MLKQFKEPSKEDAELERLIDSAIESTAAILNGRHDAPYDGVLGKLPDWFPASTQRTFAQARDRLLDARRYKPQEVRKFISADIDDYRYALERPHNSRSAFPFSLPIKVRSDVRILAHIWTAAQMEEFEGLAFLTDQRLADSVQISKRHRRTQSLNASKPRASKIGRNKTIHQIIGEIALSEANDLQTAPSLWPTFKEALVGRGLFLKEVDHSKDAWKSRYEYSDERDRRRSMALGTFVKVVSEYRTGRKKLP